MFEVDSAEGGKDMLRYGIRVSVKAKLSPERIGDPGYADSLRGDWDK
jgi:hypothetical protein